jgi:hypothetical protein
MSNILKYSALFSQSKGVCSYTDGSVVCAGAGIAQVAYRQATGATAEGSKFESRSQDVFYVVRADTKNFFILINSIFLKYFLSDQNVQLQNMHPFGSAMSSSNNPQNR